MNKIQIKMDFHILFLGSLVSFHTEGVIMISADIRTFSPALEPFPPALFSTILGKSHYNLLYGNLFPRPCFRRFENKGGEKGSDIR